MVRISCLSCFSWFPPRRNRTTKGTNHTNKRMARVPNLVGRSMGSNEQLKLPVYNGDPKPSILNHHDTHGSNFVSFVFFVVPTAQESIRCVPWFPKFFRNLSSNFTIKLCLTRPQQKLAFLFPKSSSHRLYHPFSSHRKRPVDASQSCKPHNPRKFVRLIDL